MKAVMIGLALSLFLVMGCGKKGESKTQEQAKATSKPVAVLWEFETGRPLYSSPAIGSDGTVYGGSEDNKLYAIKTDSKGLAKSPWPMRGQNAQHTGRSSTRE